MGVETEVKIRLEEKEPQQVRERLLDVGIELRDRQYEVNLLFDYPDGRLRSSGCAFRLRITDSKALLTFKGKQQKDPTFKKRPEFETPVEDPDAAREIIEALGLRVCFRYEKYREKGEWELDGRVVEICIDETAVGDFIEIEGDPETIRVAAGQLGWGPERFLTESYIDLFTQAGLGTEKGR